MPWAGEHCVKLAWFFTAYKICLPQLLPNNFEPKYILITGKEVQLILFFQNVCHTELFCFKCLLRKFLFRQNLCWKILTRKFIIRRAKFALHSLKVIMKVTIINAKRTILFYWDFADLNFLQSTKKQLYYYIFSPGTLASTKVSPVLFL